MPSPLTDRETRILGSLMEKSLSTPDYYPLSLNALTAACNQKSNRDPVVDYSDAEVRAALDEMEAKGLVNPSRIGRVPKYEECFAKAHNLVPREVAVLCVLMLRGPQTPGEVRGRSGRLCNFESLEAVVETLAKLADWGLVQRMARLPGHKEARFAHLLGETPEDAAAQKGSRSPSDDSALQERVDHLESELVQLREDVAQLKQRLEAFQAQFE
jgi:uncharacterized protein YceH (UPF0502 family)